METRALLIDDNKADYAHIRAILKSVPHHNIMLDWVGTSSEGYDSMKGNGHDVYLLDYRLDGQDGIELFERALRDGCSRPVVFLTGHGDRALDLRAMELGAADFLEKDRLDTGILERAIRYAVQNWKIRNALAVSVQEKEVLLREIHHRVKNNLQIVSSMLRLQSRKVENGRARAALIECCDRIQSIGLIHNQLYRERRFHAISFSEYMQSLINEVIHAYGVDPNRIQIESNVEASELPLTLAVPCGLIIHEMLTNAIKHAFPKGGTGKVSISFKKNSARDLELIVRDSGIGIPTEFMTDQPDSLGLELIRALGSQIHAAIEITNSNGTEWKLIFPDHLPR